MKYKSILSCIILQQLLPNTTLFSVFNGVLLGLCWSLFLNYFKYSEQQISFSFRKVKKIGSTWNASISQNTTKRDRVTVAFWWQAPPFQRSQCAGTGRREKQKPLWCQDDDELGKTRFLALSTKGPRKDNIPRSKGHVWWPGLGF